MKQTFGLLLTLFCIPLLLLLIREVKSELVLAKQQEQKIESTIVLPQVSPTLPVRLVDRTGKVFSEEYVDWSQPLPLSDIPQLAQKLFIISEDKDFYTHKGFDIGGIARAVIVNANDQDIQQGASTITQQLVRMRYLSAEKTYERKLTELFFAYELEQTYTKDQILEMYLNEMYFSNQVYGIGAAASYYFSKPLQKLTIEQLAFIAAIPNNPSLYDPIRNFEGTKNRQERLLDQLGQSQLLTPEQVADAKSAPIKLNIKQKIQAAPTYSTYVMQELRWLVAQQSGLAEKIDKAKSTEEQEALTIELDQLVNELFKQGITIHTALDLPKQLHDEQAINQILGKGELQGSATVIDNKTREIISIYGGKNYKKLDLHRAYQLPRQPGSAFKPLAVYAPYFNEHAATASSIVTGGKYCVSSFCPQNYGGALYGDVTISTAFKHSYNTSALRLLYATEIGTAFQYINQFQFRSLVANDRNYAVALGGLTYGVTTLEMADAYTSFIDGYYQPARSIRKVTNAQGKELYRWKDEQKQIWAPKTVSTMRGLLADVVRSGTGVGIKSHSNYVGVKTGTTNLYHDFWVAGLNDHYTTAVWLGYDRARSMQALEKQKIHFSIFNTIMK